MKSNKGNPHIYILRDAGNNALKIGYTLDLQQRLRAHSTSNPFLKLIVAFPVPGQYLETTLHKILRDFKIANTREWYQDSPELRDSLRAFFVTNGFNVNPDWDSVDISIPSSAIGRQNICSALAIKLTPYYLGLLGIEAWIGGRSTEKQATDDLIRKIEERQLFRIESLTYLAHKMEITYEQLWEGILNGTIAMNSTIAIKLLESESEAERSKPSTETKTQD